MGNVTVTAKFWLLLVGLVGGIAMVIIAGVIGDDGMRQLGGSIVLLVLGYLVGNGRLIQRGEAPQPALEPRTLDRRAEDHVAEADA